MTPSPSRAADDGCVYSETDLVQYFSETTGISEGAATGFLHEAVSAGFMVVNSQGEQRFNLAQTENWLRGATRLYQHVLQNASFARTNRTSRQRGINPDPTIIRYKGAYTFHIERDASIPLTALLINLNTPAPHLCQRQIELKNFDPPALAEYLDVPNGLFAQIPAVLCTTNGGFVRYEFECEVEEQTPATWVKSKHALSHLRFSYPESYRDGVERVLKSALDTMYAEDDEAVARAVFRFLLDNFAYAKTSLPDSSILETGSGTCVHLTRLFANVLRLRGIPVREQCGALMSRAVGHNRVQTIHREYSPFSHTWAEVYLAGRGWAPVDFLAMQHGQWAATEHNVDPALREEMNRDTPNLVKYYFGNLDPYRIFAGPFANRMPCLLMLEGATAREAKGFEHLTRHVLECELISWPV